MPELKIDVVSELTDAFIVEWQDFWQRAQQRHFYNSPGWFLACVEAWEIREFKVFACRIDGVLVGICPLISFSKFGLKVMANPGVEMYDLSAFHVSQDAEAVVPAMLKAMVRQGTVYLKEVDEVMAAHLHKSQVPMVSRTCSTSSYLPLAPDPLRYFPKDEARKILNRFHKHQPQVRYQVFTTDALSAMPAIYEIEAASNKQSKAKDIFSDPAIRRLFENNIKTQPDKWMIHVLYQDDQPIAYDIKVFDGKVCRGLQKGYLREFRYFSPGKLLHLLFIPQLYEQGFEVIDLSRGVDFVKGQFTPFVEKHYDFAFTQNPLALRWLKMVFWLKDWVEKNPGSFEMMRKVKRLGK